MTSHSRRAGASKYPIIAGHVIKLNRKRVRFNKKLKIKEGYPHTLFVWVRKIYVDTKEVKVQPKYRRIKLLAYYLPDSPFGHDDYFMEEKKVQMEWLARMMNKKSGGYEVVATKCIDHKRRDSVGKFYRIIGAL